MASVELTEAWIHLATDLSVYITHPLRDIREVADSRSEVRTYAGGRRRLITGPARPSAYDVSFVRLPSAKLQTLRDWRATLLLLRDYQGRAIWGSYRTLQVVDWRGEGSHDVSFEFTQVTHSEAV